jgi:hypothetical protein
LVHLCTEKESVLKKSIRSEEKHPFWRKASVIEFWNCLLWQSWMYKNLMRR